MYRGAPLNDTPYHADVNPGPIYAENTLVEGLDNNTGDNGTFYVQARDIYGNDVLNISKNEFYPKFQPLCAESTVNCAPTAVHGQLMCQYSVTVGGVYCVVIDYLNYTAPVANASVLTFGGTACESDSRCSYQGYCFQNAASTTEFSCNCFQGFTGSDCSTKMSSKYPLTVGAAVGVIIGVGVVLFLLGLVIGALVIPKILANRSGYSAV